MLGACSSSEETFTSNAEERFKIAMDKFQDEDYLEALEDFKIVTLQFLGSTLADDAQYYMAECRFKREEYVLASYEYELLLKTMPTSEFVSRARFQRALCYYQLSPESYRDQEYTKKAIDEFQSFIEYHPTDSLVSNAEAKIAEMNTKLAQKEYDNGITYMHMEYYKAAVNSFDYVLEKYYDSPYAESAQLKKAEAMYYRKKFPEAKQEIEKFFAKYPNSALQTDAEKLKQDILDKIQQGGAAPQKQQAASAQQNQ